MYGLLVRFRLRAGAAEAFDALVDATVQQIRTAEPGTLLYATTRVEGKPDVRVFVEVYRDRGAFEEHERQPHTRHMLAEREQHLAAPPEVEFFDVLAAAGLPAP